MILLILPANVFAAGNTSYSDDYDDIDDLIDKIKDYDDLWMTETYPDVYDYANLLTSSEESKLSSMASQYKNKYNVNVVFLTYSNAQGKSTMRYTDDFYDNLYYDASGILFAIDMDNREMYINTVGSCINALSDRERNQVFDKTENYVVNKEYYKFFSNACELSFDKMYETGSSSADRSPLMPDGAAFVLSFLVMIIVLLVLLAKHNKANKQISATNYMPQNGYVVNNRQERYVRTYETVQRGYYRESNSSSGGGGSSSHSSSSGVSHGGGGRRF